MSEPPVITNIEVRPPSVITRPSEATNIEATSNLPLGVKVTGGVKLRSQGLTGQGVRVAVIDTGVDKDHPGFNNQVKNQTWYRGGPMTNGNDHGTHVAGTIHLMAPDAEIYDYRVLGTTGDISFLDALQRAIMAAATDGCHVINMSVGEFYPDAGMHSAVQYAHSKGVAMVCAAGNEGDRDPLTNENRWPASFTECISVAAVKKMDNLPVARFSNSNDEIDYSGIGVDVTSFKAGGGYQEMSGTSMAAPHVTGFIAALLSHPEYRVGDLRDKLKKFCIDIGVAGTDRMTGVGFLTCLTKEQVHDLLPDEPEPCTIL